MIIVTFSVRYRAGVDPADICKLSFSPDVIEALFALEGFVSWDLYKPMVADGTILMILRFDTIEAVSRWRDHPIHVPMIRLGPDLMEFYDIQIAQVVREYIWEEDGYLAGNPADFYRERSFVRPDRIPQWKHCSVRDPHRDKQGIRGRISPRSTRQRQWVNR